MAQKTQKNGLEQAMISLIQNQAAFLSSQIAANERFARIENELAEIKAILLRHEDLLRNHERILQALPEAIRQKIGFEGR